MIFRTGLGGWSALGMQVMTADMNSGREALLRDTPLLVINHQRWSWRKRLSLAAAIFGGIWLAIEPLLAFSLGKLALPWWSYILMVAVSLSIPMIVEARRDARRIRQMELVDLTIRLVRGGVSVPVRAPLDFLISEFQDRLLESLGRVAPFESSFIPLYQWNLLHITESGERILSGHKTLREMALKSGDVCMVRGYIRAEHRMRYGNIVYAQMSYKNMSKRRAGLSLLDEKAADVLGSYSIDKGPALGEATLFMVDNAGAAPNAHVDDVASDIQKALLRKGWKKAGTEIDSRIFERNFTRDR